MIRTSGGLGARGKLHSWDEYVTLDAGAPPFVVFDQWVADNMDAALARGGDWPSRYRHGRVYAFVRASGGAAPLLAGALGPSHDRAGRNYPLFAAGVVESDGDATFPLAVLPLLLEDLWGEASRVVTQATEAGTVASLGALVRGAAVDPVPDLSSAVEGWEHWTRGMRLDELSALLFDAPEVGHLAAALGDMQEAVGPHRAVFPPRTRLSLRLPLGRAGGAAVCLWLAVAQRTLRWAGVFPSFFWTHDGGLGELFLHLGIPSKNTLGQLFMPAPADDVMDVVPRVDAGRTERIPSTLEGVLMTEGATVAELLTVL